MRLATLGTIGLLLSLSACADGDKPTQPNTSSETKSDVATEKTAMVPSVIFIQYLNQQAPQLLCEQDAGVACLQMPNELCMASVEASAERCGPMLLTQWPERFPETQESAQKYAQEYRNCMLQDWVNEFGLQQSRLDACGISLPSP